jgi:O-6-methylguanine DNA methyltransferase
MTSRLIRLTFHHDITDITLFANALPGGRCALLAVSLGAHAALKGKPVLESPHPMLRKYARLLRTYLNGSNKDLSAIRIFTDGFSEFRRRVTETARKIPYGRTVSYASLARRAGYPRAVRAVASVMRNNPFALVVPCHRVIRSDGTIGGFAGKKSGRPIALKRRLLELEKKRPNSE